MANDATAGPNADRSARFDQIKQEATEKLLADSLRFVQWDGDVNDLVKDLLSTVVAETKRDPTRLFAVRQTDDSRVSQQEVPASPLGPGLPGLDGPFKNIIDFINAIGNLARYEKDFFLKIIFLIFCNCECVCKCLCPCDCDKKE